MRDRGRGSRAFGDTSVISGHSKTFLSLTHPKGPKENDWIRMTMIAGKYRVKDSMVRSVPCGRNGSDVSAITLCRSPCHLPKYTLTITMHFTVRITI